MPGFISDSPLASEGRPPSAEIGACEQARPGPCGTSAPNAIPYPSAIFWHVAPSGHPRHQ